MSARASCITTLALLVTCLAAMLLAWPAEGATKAQKKVIETLPQKYQQWLLSVDLLITKPELEAFLELEQDYQREAFIDHFWRQRDRYKSTARNEFRTRWESRFQQAVNEFGSVDDDRVRIFLMNGHPANRIPSNCSPLWPLEIWFYQPHQPEGPGMELLLIFYQRFGDGRYRIWDPVEGVAALTKFMGSTSTATRVYDEIRSSCTDSDTILGAINYLGRQGSFDFNSRLAQATERRHGPESGEWVATFNSFSTDLPDDAETFPARFEVLFPGRYQTRTVVQTSVFVDAAEIDVSELGGAESYNFVLVGEILRDDKLFDNFPLPVQHSSRGRPSSGELPLIFERKVRPGATESSSSSRT